ncbi:uncharacterized protein BDV14DRAFT_197378 [Aspergillus stella-maris]|uniref:uncharacterized protein n=1 Tax=Aspergillus stella-maris TaxID=1810926 RepID=UPI003CCDC11B
MTTPPEPIAILGLACRFPGDANTPEKLWEIVRSGTQCWSDVPEDRYNWKAFHHPSPDARGTHNARGGFFINEDISRFDANFFGIPAAEAAAIDPQQRLLLEVSYEALENAGCSLQSLRGSNTGAYVALVSRDYDRMSYRDPSQLAKHHLTGCGDATACGRISYVFDLHGPSMSLDTGCSGGMVALHLAVQALRAGETSRAIVGGTNLLLDPDMTIAMSSLHMINDNGKSYPFDARGAGYGRGEGVAVLVLKRLTDAIEDGDSIRAVIRHSGMNQDGKTNGILMPSSESQQALAKSLYRQAGLDPLDVSYVEAHGTGTQAGDLAELTSITRVFSGSTEERRRQRPLFLGSVKANIGHSESTSGLAGVIKTVLALEKGIIPPLAELETVKPSLEGLLENGNIIIPQQPRNWPSDTGRLASVNSFGFGGTNAHVILESAPASSSPQNEVHAGISDSSSFFTAGSLTPLSDSEDDLAEEEPLLFVFSAKSKSSLEATIRDTRQWVLTHGIAYRRRQQLSQTLFRRSQFNWRTNIVASSYNNLLSALDDRNCRFSKASSNPQIVFIFTGQGAQHAGMGKELLLWTESTFARSIYTSRDILLELGASWDLAEELLRDDATSRINSSEVSQPATTAVQIAIVDLLAHLGVRPAAVLGHSSGEVAAAYAAGALGHREALTIAYYKGFVSAWCKESVPSKGAMLAVGLSEAEATQFVRQKQGPGQCVVACVNSPSSVTISGDEEAVIEVQKLLTRASIFNRRLKVNIAYHSHHMHAVSERFRSCLDGTFTAPPRDPIKYFSSVTGLEVTSSLDSSYWVDNLVSQVRFAPALVQLIETMGNSITTHGTLALVEIGPHSALKGPARQIMSSLDSTLTGKWSYTPTLIRGEDAHLASLRTVQNLFEQGISIRPKPELLFSTEAEHHQIATPIVDLPSYPWDHTNQYWHESRLSKDYRLRSHAPHDLLGLRLPGTSTIEPIFRHFLSADDLPWLQEHIIDGFALYPGSAFLCMAIEALRQVTMDRGEKREITKYTFRDISFSKALVVPDSPGFIEVLLSLRPSHGAHRKGTRSHANFIWEDFAISSIAENGTWNEHCGGSIRAEFRVDASSVEAESMSPEYLHDMKAQCRESVPPETIYADMRRNGIDYGDNFAIIRHLRLGDHQAIAKVEVPDVSHIMPAQHMQPHIIHPTIFDAFMHVVLPLYHRHCSQGPVMLVSVGEVSISADIAKQPGDELMVACRLTRAGRRAGSVEVEIFQEDDQGVLKQVGSLSQEDFRAIGEGAPEQIKSPLSCYYVDWIPVDLSTLPSRIALKGGSTRGRRVNISCYPETPRSLLLAGDLVSHLQSTGDMEDCSLLHSGLETLDPGSIHVIFIGQSVSPRDLLLKLNRLSRVLCVSVMDDEQVTGISLMAAFLSDSHIARVAQQLLKDATVVTLDYYPGISALQEVISELLSRSFLNADGTSGRDIEYIYRDSALQVPRLALHGPANEWMTVNSQRGYDVKEEISSFHGDDVTLQLHINTPGLLESAVFVPTEDVKLQPDEVAVKVYAHGVIKADVMIVLDRADPTESILGEFAGVVTDVGLLCKDVFEPGDRVCGWSFLPYTNIARVKSHLVQRLSESISFTEGASIPVAFQTAYHALVTLAGLEKGQSILIHGAAGAVGQAAIALAQYLELEIYANVGVIEEEHLLIEKKGIPKTKVFSSRTTSFKDSIVQRTGGRGVDMVLNCLSADLLQESVSIVADFGYLIDVTKSSNGLRGGLGKNITFASIDLSPLAQKRPQKLAAAFEEIMHLYNAQRLAPITFTKMSLEDISDAFRLVQSHRCSGKLVLDAGDTAVVRRLHRKQRQQTLLLTGDESYAVVGGSSRLNGALCDFMKRRGAKQIVSIMPSAEGERAGKYTPDGILCGLPADLRGIIYVEGRAQREDVKHTGDYEQNTETAIWRTIDSLPSAFCIRLTSIDCLRDSEGSIPTHKLSTTLRLASIEGHTQDSGSSLTQRDLENLLDYCLTTTLEHQQGGHREIIAGPDMADCKQDDPFYSSILKPSTTEDSLGVSKRPSSTKIDQQIANATNIEEIHDIVLKASTAQLATFLATDAEDINTNSSVAELGLDSLLAIEFKNWIVRTLQAPMQTSEILDAPSLTNLVQLIIRRSKIVRKDDLPSKTPADIVKTNGIHEHSSQSSSTPSFALPPLPIPELRTLIDRHLSYLRAFATDNEFNSTMKLAADFQAQGSMGQRLYDRLQTIRAANPERWYHDLYLKNQYLVRKGPLAPFMSFFFTHPETNTSHKQSQAERAAIVAATVIQYKARLEKVEITPRVVNEQPLCMDLYKYLFNTVREPAVGIDLLRQYPGNDYFVVLRRGQVYRVNFQQSLSHSTILQKLLEPLHQILQETRSREIDWLGMLTAGDRTSWAKARQKFMSISQENTAYIETIEKSAFTVCLDDGRPVTPDERGRHFHFGDGSNRWHDKPIEFIIAANGASGILGDHTALDAGTVHELNTEIVRHIQQYQPKHNVIHTNGTIASNPAATKAIPIPHSFLPPTHPIASLIQSIKTSYNAACAVRQHRYPAPLPFGSALMQRHKIPANSAFQIIVQLAARYYFDHITPCWETVLQSNFATGRVEINQVVSEQIKAFVEAVVADCERRDEQNPKRSSSSVDLRRLLVEAVRTHSSSVLACTRAGGSDRFLSMLREIVSTEDGEEEPGLYHDPVYKRARPRKLVSNCFATGMAENGCCLRDEEGVWLHFEVEADSVKFCILGPREGTERFVECLERAAAVVRGIIEGSG